MNRWRIYIFSVFLWIIVKAWAEFHKTVWGTGLLLGGFSLKWGFLFILFSLFLVALLILLGFSLWKTEKLESFHKNIVRYRNRAGHLSWLLAFALLLTPPVFFQYTLWGLVFTGIYFRLLVCILLVLLLAVLITKDAEKLISFSALLTSTLLFTTSLALASVFANARDYPFNLYWSDGNRLWDYSIMFGRGLYNITDDQPIPVLISSGRQFLWGLPFLLPNTTIFFNRFWSAFILSFPYMVLGWVAFKTKNTKASEALLFGFWTFLFLNQGPIYTPLVFSAILVVLVWERSLWLAIPAVVLAGYYAEITRYTWKFAPAMWVGMLTLNGSKLKDAWLRDWIHAIILGVSGVLFWILANAFSNLQDTGSLLAVILAWILIAVFLEKLLLSIKWKQGIFTSKQRIVLFSSLVIVLVAGVVISNGDTKIAGLIKGTYISIQNDVSVQPLLWSRLLPNDTYPEGILGGLLIATLPLVIILFYLLKKKNWQPSLWQKLAIIGSLFPFLIVGLIISTKIGGGNNLHNLDMFLIALLFVAAIAWRNGGREWFLRAKEYPLWLQVALILLIALPALPSLRGMRPQLSLSQAEIEQVKILADTDNVETLPSTEEINDAIWFIRHAINDWQDKGEILFIDQRQLLTFGYVPQIPLVPEYEKKRMMNEAMSSNAAYFAPYYEDLAAQRFSLIITEPLKVEIKDEEGVFAAENDLWTKWVAAPTLCYYEPLETLYGVYIQLLIPREEVLDCSPYLP